MTKLKQIYIFADDAATFALEVFFCLMGKIREVRRKTNGWLQWDVVMWFTAQDSRNNKFKGRALQDLFKIFDYNI